jgi:hypothetical protein
MRRMTASTFIDMRALVTALEHRHRIVRSCCIDECERLELDARVRTTAQRALATIALYEEEPMRERAAIGAMYEACEAGLATLALLASLRPPGEQARVMHEMIEDLQTLISDLFEWLMPLAVRPSERVQH